MESLYQGPVPPSSSQQQNSDDLFVSLINSSFHLYYVTPQGHIKEIWWDKHPQTKSWRSCNLMNDFSKSNTFPLAAYPQRITGAIIQGKQHIFYVGQDDNLHNLHWAKERWALHSFKSKVDLAASSLYATSDNQTASIFFVVPGGHLCCLLWNGSNEGKLVDVTFKMSTNDTLHATNVTVVFPNIIFYTRKDDTDVHSIVYQNHQYYYTNLTKASHSAPCAPGRLCVYLTGTTPHVIYRTTENHIQEIFYASNQWRANDLTNRANAYPAYSSPSGFAVTTDQRSAQCIFYLDKHGKLCELFIRHVKGAAWTFYDLTAIVKAHPNIGTPITLDCNMHRQKQLAFVFSRMGEIIYEFYWKNNHWYHSNLSFKSNAVATRQNHRHHGYYQPSVMLMKEDVDMKDVDDINNQPTPQQANEKEEEEVKEKVEEKQPTNECVVCLDNNVNAVVLPCAHANLCLDCAETLLKTTKKCPVCVQAIQQVLKIYL